MEMDDWWFGWKGFIFECFCSGKVVLMVGVGIFIDFFLWFSGGYEFMEVLFDYLFDSNVVDEIKMVFG